MTKLKVGEKNDSKTTTTSWLPSIVYKNQYYNKQKLNLNLKASCFKQPQGIYAPSSSLAFARIIDREEQIFL